MISEIVRSDPHPGVVSSLAEHEDLWLSSIVVHELEYGVRRLPQGQRRTHLQVSLLHLTTEYDDRILPLDRTSAELAAQFRTQAQHAGLTLDLGDALIAGSAKTPTSVSGTVRVGPPYWVRRDTGNQEQRAATRRVRHSPCRAPLLGAQRHRQPRATGSDKACPAQSV